MALRQPTIRNFIIKKRNKPRNQQLTIKHRGALALFSRSKKTNQNQNLAVMGVSP